MKNFIFIVLCLFILIFYIPTYWRIFTKLGRKGWEGIIPIYNRYIFFNEVWDKKVFLMDLFFTFIGIAFAIAFSYTEMFIYDLLVVFVNIVRFIIQFMFCNKTADVFGKGKYFGIWLAFFPIICYPILAFGRAIPRERRTVWKRWRILLRLKDSGYSSPKF